MSDRSTRRKGARKSGSRKALDDDGGGKSARKSGSRKGAKDSGSRKGARKSGSRKALDDDERKGARKSGSRKGVKDSGSRKGARKSGSRRALGDDDRKGAKKSGSRKALGDSGSRKGAKKSGSRKGVSDSGSRKGARKSGSRKALGDSGRRRGAGPQKSGSPLVWVVLGLLAIAAVGGGYYVVGGGPAPASDPAPSVASADVEVEQPTPPPVADAPTEAQDPDAEATADAKDPDAEADPDAEPSADPAPDEPKPEAPADDELATAPIKGETDTGVVARVVDGDTFHLEDGRKVRLIGINTPEKKSNDPLNREATALLKELVDGKTVTLEFDAERTDQFKRTLAHVFVGDVYVNGEIVRQGLAYCYTWKPNTAHTDDLAPFQLDARDKGRGLWGLEPPEPADHYEASRSAHRFHRPGCKKGPRSNSKRTFNTRNEAFDAGLNPCSDCKP